LPTPPYFLQSLCACALVVQPRYTHTARVLSPCLLQSPRSCALVVQPGWTHGACASPSCLPQSPHAVALGVQPGCAHTAFALPPCLMQSHRLSALVWMQTHSLCTPAVLDAESLGSCFGGAAWMHTQPVHPHRANRAPYSCVGGAPWHRAQTCGTVLLAALSLVDSHGGAVSNQAHPVRTVFGTRTPWYPPPPPLP
jgi:hypothetical protein